MDDPSGTPFFTPPRSLRSATSRQSNPECGLRVRWTSWCKPPPKFRCHVRLALPVVVFEKWLQPSRRQDHCREQDRVFPLFCHGGLRSLFSDAAEEGKTILLLLRPHFPQQFHPRSLDTIKGHQQPPSAVVLESPTLPAPSHCSGRVRNSYGPTATEALHSK
jgi:hypothetical protein